MLSALPQKQIRYANRSWFRLIEAVSNPILGGNAVHLWEAKLDLVERDLEIITEFLSPTERERASRFRFQLDQRRFVAGRGLLRQILADYHACRPEEISFGYSQWGKPFVLSPRHSEFEFNLAHSQDHLLVAVSARPIGVDLEAIRSIDDLDLLARQICSERELEAWLRLPLDSRLTAFFTLWTRKEALLKAMGTGISEHLREISVFFSSDWEVSIPACLTDLDWHIESLFLGEHLAGAVAVGACEKRSSNPAEIA
jgi:4'-phosphopantetheinyl transferase